MGGSVAVRNGSRGGVQLRKLPSKRLATQKCIDERSQGREPPIGKLEKFGNEKERCRRGFERAGAQRTGAKGWDDGVYGL